MTPSTIAISPSGAALGAEIRGVRLDKLSDEEFHAIHRAWLDHLITRRVNLKNWDEAYQKRENDVKTVLLFED